MPSDFGNGSIYGKVRYGDEAQLFVTDGIKPGNKSKN